MLVRHLIYGLRIAADCAIPGLLPVVESDAEFDLRVHLKARRRSRQVRRPPPAEFFYTQSRLQ